MAGLIKLKEKYYARIYNISWKKSGQIAVFLDTGKIREAKPRKREVEFYEAEIRSREISLDEITFSWNNPYGVAEVKARTLEDVIGKYISNRKANRYRASTLTRYRHALDSFADAVGRKRPVEGLGLNDIEAYKKRMTEKDLKTGGINLNLRTLKTFLRWMAQDGREYIPKAPTIEFLPEEIDKPAYLSNVEFAEIIKALGEIKFRNPDDRQYYEKAFWLYRETGLRVSEPFLGKLDGQILIIPPANIKSKREHEKYIRMELMPTLEEMQARFQAYKREYKNTSDLISRHTRIFQKACKNADIKGKTEHSLRHTYAVRLYLLTGDIYRVQRELGHSTLDSTQKYTGFSFERLKAHFPDLADAYFERAEIGQKRLQDALL